MQTSKLGQMNFFVKTGTAFAYPEREPRKTWLTWLVWGKILGMKPHPEVTNTSLEEWSVYMRSSEK